jgi:hypothetical protein
MVPNINIRYYQCLIIGQGYEEKDGRYYHPSAPIWTPPAHLVEIYEQQQTLDPLGPWTDVEPEPEPVVNETEPASQAQPEAKKSVDDMYDEEDQGGDKLAGFKIVEKEVEVLPDEDAPAEPAVFKKRKFAAQGNQRKIRKK